MDGDRAGRRPGHGVERRGDLVEPEPTLLAVVAPSAMLVAEALFLAIDRKVWRYDLGAETYRLIDLGVMLALLVGGLVLP